MVNSLVARALNTSRTSFPIAFEDIMAVEEVYV